MSTTMTTISRLPDEEVFRVTKEGRKLKYCLTVIQQPERARACGSGAKSSADRRPVDPPPVVELRIFDVTTESQDITFSYDANFFLFATLEVARPMAHGRLQAPPPQIPVLTGMPVSGMAYLDRPAEAGYFIFPDLSVRHEGRYKLSFNLYEETKHAKDADAEPSRDPGRARAPVTVPNADSSFDWRMEVKSNAFTVFSAKKFPGLAESTALSKTVAEQGCRVRIRRDVRMRRRDGKDEGTFAENEDEYTRPHHRLTTPAEAESRQPTDTSPKFRGRQTPSAQSSRRESIDLSSQTYPHACTPSSVSSRSTAPSSTTSVYPAFGMPVGNGFPSVPMPPAPSAAPMYQPSLEYHRAGQYRQAPAPYTFPEKVVLPPQWPVSMPTGIGPRDMFDADHRRSSLSSYGTSPPPSRAHLFAVDAAPPHKVVPPFSGMASRQTSPSSRSPVDLPPFKAVDRDVQRAEAPRPVPSTLISSDRIVGTDKVTAGVLLQASSAVSHLEQAISPDARTPGGKRVFDDVFTSMSTRQPLFNGRRPSSEHDSDAGLDDDDFFDIEKLKMQYKRADGSKYSRALPSVQ